MRHAHQVLAALLPFALSTTSYGQCEPATFTGLGMFPDTTVAAVSGVSADGSTVVGYAYTLGGGPSRPYRWTVAGGLQDLGLIPGDLRAFAYAVNADGTVVVGGSDSPSGYERAFRWTAAGGMQPLDPALSPGHSRARAVSADGTVVAGGATGGAFRWVEGVGLQTLGISQLCTASDAWGLSSDGAVMVGNQRFRWTTTTGFACLEQPLPSSISVIGLSGDGRVALGSTSGGDQWFPTYWSEDGQAHLLGPAPAGGTHAALAANNDGSVIVGYLGSSAFIWTPAYGLLQLEDVLRVLGADLTDWTLTYARGVSADGSVIAGVGEHRYGAGSATRREGFIATVPVLLTAQPRGTLACNGADRRFEVRAIGAAVPFDFNWRRDGVPITGDDPHIVITEAADGRGSTLHLNGVRRGDAGTYDCIVTGVSCPGLGAFSTGLRICPADYDCDGAPNSSDISAYLTAWLASLGAGDVQGDFDGDSAVNSSDISAFLTTWLEAVQGGC